MNFFLCNRCNKNSDENIFNFNHEEIILKDSNHYYTNIDNNFNMICQTNTSEKFPDININNLEDDDDDDLKIIEYPYKLREEKDSINENKLKPKEFKKNKSKFNDNNNVSNNNDNYLIEKDIINKLNYIDKNKDSSKLKNFKYLIIPKNNNNNANDRVIEKKDTLTDPSNLALSSLMFEINKTNKNKSKLNKIEEKQEINSTQNETNYNNIDKNKNGNKILNNHNKKYKFTRKVQRKDYPNNIIKKRNILKINNIYNNNMYNNNLKLLNLYTHSKKKIPKSNSFNYSQTDKKNSIKVRTEINNIDKYKFNINLPSNNNKVKTVFTPQINQNKINYKMNIEKNKNK